MNNPPAFPSSTIAEGSESSYTDEWYKGMTLLDYFAAKAIQGMYSNPEYSAHTEEKIAEIEFRQSRAMLKARENQTPEH